MRHILLAGAGAVDGVETLPICTAILLASAGAVDGVETLTTAADFDDACVDFNEYWQVAMPLIGKRTLSTKLQALVMEEGGAGPTTTTMVARTVGLGASSAMFLSSFCEAVDGPDPNEAVRGIFLETHHTVIKSEGQQVRSLPNLHIV